MRDQKHKKGNFIEFINDRKASLSKRQKKLDEKRIKPERINIVMREMSKTSLYLSIAQYSIGSDLKTVQRELIQAIEYAYESWDGFWKLKDSNGSELKQYILSAYDEMLWMLSLGYLLNISNEAFNKLVEIIDRDEIKDFLFEFIVKAKISDRSLLEKESYSVYFGVPKVFEKLRQAIDQKGDMNSKVLIKEFIDKDWYSKHKDAGWYNSHKSKHNEYFGYWSFETAAVTCILGLEDKSYRENEFYPKDLVDHYRKI